MKWLIALMCGIGLTCLVCCGNSDPKCKYVGQVSDFTITPASMHSNLSVITITLDNGRKFAIKQYFCSVATGQYLYYYNYGGYQFSWDKPTDNQTKGQ